MEDFKDHENPLRQEMDTIAALYAALSEEEQQKTDPLTYAVSQGTDIPPVAQEFFLRVVEMRLRIEKTKRDIDETTVEQIGQVTERFLRMNDEERRGMDIIAYAINQGMEVVPNMHKHFHRCIEMVMLLESLSGSDKRDDPTEE